MAKFNFTGLAIGEHRKDGEVYAKNGECIRFQLGDVIASNGNDIKIMKLDADEYEFEYWLHHIEQVVEAK